MYNIYLSTYHRHTVFECSTHAKHRSIVNTRQALYFKGPVLVNGYKMHNENLVPECFNMDTMHTQNIFSKLMYLNMKHR